MKSIQEYWDQTLQCMQHELNVSEIKINAFFRSIKPVDVKGDTLILSVDIGFYKETIKKTFDSSLKEALTIVFGKPMNYRIFTEAELETAKFDEIEEKPVKEEVEDMTGNKSYVRENGLKTNYEFDNYIVGSSNNFAYAAAVGVAENPGTEYNPLFLYGGAGLGKTHLMHSIAHFILEHDENSRVLYVTSEEFTNELIETIRNGNNTAMSKFREKYRNIDVLLVDDIQFIIGKESTQEEFFHTFNSLHSAKKQIIISSDKPPKDMEILEERFRSRFEWGLIADITLPDYETRMAILHKNEEMNGYNISEDVIKYIATNIKSNIRELEGAFNKVMAGAKLEKKEVTLELAEQALKDIISPDEKKVITPEYIISVVAEHYGVTPADLSGNKRNSKIVMPRQVSMYLCREIISTPLKNIGKALGNRDHTTVMHGIEKIENELQNDDNLKNTIDILKKKINPQG